MKKIILLLIVATSIWGMSACSSSAQKPTANPSDSLSPTGIPSHSMNNEIQIGFELNSYTKDELPYTDVTLIIQSGKQEEKILIGSYLGIGHIIEAFENREFFQTDSITGCQVYYAGGGDNVFAYIEDLEIKVKHNEFVLGNDEVDSEIIKEEVVFTREIGKDTAVKVIDKDITTPSPITEVQKSDHPETLVSTSFSDSTNEYSYSVPKIEINSDDVNAINKEIQDEYQFEVEEEIIRYQQGYRVFLYSVDYDVFLNDTILSLLIRRKYEDDFIVYQTYNVDISSGKNVSNTQLLQYTNLTDSDLLSDLPNLLSDEFIRLNGRKDTYIENMKAASAGYTEEEIEDFRKEYTNQYDLTIDQSNYGIDMPMFLDSDGKLKIIAKIYSLDDSDYYFKLVDAHE